MYRLLLNTISEAWQTSFMLGLAAKEAGTTVHAAYNTLPCCRCVIPTRPSVASHLARGRTSSAMAVSKDAAAAPGSRPPKRRTTSRSDNQLEQQHHSDLRAANGRAAVATQQPPNSQHDPARSASQSGVSAASPQRPPTLGQDSHGDSNGLIQQHGSDSQPSAVEQRAKGGLLTNSLGPRPRPRRSTSKSMSAVDDKAHGVAASTATKPGAGANNDAAGTTPGSDQAGEQAAAAAVSVDPVLAAPVDVSALQVQQQLEPNMRLRNRFTSRRAAQALVGPSSNTLSEEAAAWIRRLGVHPDVLQSWGAGMAVVQHPDLKQGQVEVLALPYYLGGKLVDVRYLQLSGGQLVGSWLAVGAGAVYMREQEAKAASILVFVGDELDALLLSALGIAAVAIPKQWPIFGTSASAAAEASVAQQQEQQQQQQEQQQWPPLLQASLWRQQQQHSSVQQGYEDPRLRLEGLKKHIENLKHEQNIIASSQSSREGLVVTDVTQSYVSGLSLMFPAASTAVIAMDSGPVGDAVGSELASMLGEVACRQVLWPSTALPADAAADAATAGSADQSAGLVQDPAAAAGTGAGAAAEAGVAPAADPSATPSVTLQQYLRGLEQQLWTANVQYWNFPLVYAIYGATGVCRCVSDACIWPIAGLERFSEHAADLLAYYKTPDVRSLAVSTGWESLDEHYKVAPGEVTVVTGVPNSGKSEWLDALAVNLAHLHGWKFAVCSMEKRPRDHGKQLAEKVAGKPMLMAAYAENVERMTEEELDAAFTFVCDHFVVIASGEDKMPSIHWVLEKARAAKIQYGISGLIIDPYNELDPTRSNDAVREHEHVNEVMSHLRKFARHNQVHCWLVAHPRQMGGAWTGQRPGLQDISGGANFMNKTDNGVVVHRDWSKMKELQQRAGKGKSSRRFSSSSVADGTSAAEQASSSGAGAAVAADDSEAAAEAGAHKPEFEVQIHIEKVRNKTTGYKGSCVLVYDRVTGRYRQLNQEPDREPLAGQPSARFESGHLGQVEVSLLPPEQHIHQSSDSVGDSASGPEQEESNLQKFKEAGLYS